MACICTFSCEPCSLAKLKKKKKKRAQPGQKGVSYYDLASELLSEGNIWKYPVCSKGRESLSDLYVPDISDNSQLLLKIMDIVIS